MAEKKFAGLEALQAFLNSCKNLFATKEKVAFIDEEDNEDVINPDIAVSDIIIDSALSATSTNPVQNKVVTEKFEELNSKIENNSGGSSSDAGGESYIAELTWNGENGEYAVIDGHELLSNNGLIEGESVCWLSDADFRTLVDILKRKILVSEIALMEMWYITYLDYDNNGEIGKIFLSTLSEMDSWIFCSQSYYTENSGW